MSYLKIIVLALTVLATLSSCSHARRADRAQIAERAKTEMIGLSRVELYTCAGVPQRTATEGPQEFMSYGASSHGWGSSCTVTFVLQDAKVQSINYSGRTGRRSQNGEQCAYAVANCLTTPDSDQE